jgi:hypothetical protein
MPAMILDRLRQPLATSMLILFAAQRQKRSSCRLRQVVTLGGDRSKREDHLANLT